MLNTSPSYARVTKGNNILYDDDNDDDDMIPREEKFATTRRSQLQLPRVCKNYLSRTIVTVDQNDKC